jgi:3D (Asp-Asp-Asp) domain-containing protein
MAFLETMSEASVLESYEEFLLSKKYIEKKYQRKKGEPRKIPSLSKTRWLYSYLAGEICLEQYDYLEEYCKDTNWNSLFMKNFLAKINKWKKEVVDDSQHQESGSGDKLNNKMVEEVVIKEAVSQVQTIGTLRRPGDPIMTSEDVKCISTLKPKEPIALDKNGKPVNYTKVITGKATAYCNHCDGNSTAYYGKNSARPGYIAVNPKMIPYGTKLYIVTPDGKTTYGYAVAADTGGFAKKNPQKTVADLRMYFSGSKCQCGSYWGRRNVEIYILK